MRLDKQKELCRQKQVTDRQVDYESWHCRNIFRKSGEPLHNGSHTIRAIINLGRLFPISRGKWNMLI